MTIGLDNNLITVYKDLHADHRKKGRIYVIVRGDIFGKRDQRAQVHYECSKISQNCRH